jgi:leader peptidase (prepilin peptidase)/N-methyltransferase
VGLLEPVKLIFALLVVVAAIPAGLGSMWVVRLLQVGAPLPRAGVMISAMACMYAWAAVAVPAGWPLAASLALAWTLFTLATIDVIAMRLPDVLTLSLTVVGLGLSLVMPGAPILGHLAGAAVGYAVLAALAWAYRRARGRDGIGLGDAKLLAAAGAWLGWAALPSVLLLACLGAFAWVAVRRLRGDLQSLTAPVAFGAPLALAFWIVWLTGPLSI